KYNQYRLNLLSDTGLDPATKAFLYHLKNVINQVSLIDTLQSESKLSGTSKHNNESKVDESKLSEPTTENNEPTNRLHKILQHQLSLIALEGHRVGHSFFTRNIDVNNRYAYLPASAFPLVKTALFEVERHISLAYPNLKDF